MAEYSLDSKQERTRKAVRSPKAKKVRIKLTLKSNRPGAEGTKGSVIEVDEKTAKYFEELGCVRLDSDDSSGE